MRRYRLTASITVGAVIFLIFVGGLVRSTGSGLGCPDWPKCFGQWVPPTDVSELPADYKTRFQVAGREIADFDAFKTWVEYLNRLVGVLIGFLTLLTAGLSWPVRKVEPRVTWFSAASLLLVLIQGGIGAIVVKTHLATWMVTLHMVIALVILMLLLTALMWSHEADLAKRSSRLPRPGRDLWWIGGGMLLLTLVQIALGTQVREQVDEVALALGESQRQAWVDALGGIYDVHKLGYYVVGLLVLLWVVRLKRFYGGFPFLGYLSAAMVLSLIIEVALGLSMHHFGILPALQPLHLLMATVLFAAEFSALGLLYFSTRQASATYNEAGKQEVLL